MKRRDTFTLLPLSLAAVTGVTADVFGQGMYSKKLPQKEPHPQPTLPLAIRYTLKVRDMLKWIRHTQSENLLEASYAIARTVKNGGTCWCSWDMGHSTMFDMFEGRNGKPGIFTMGYDAGKTKIGELGLREKHVLYYLFDFGDEWWHELSVLEIKEAGNSRDYPKIVKKAGKSPDQYPDYDECDDK